MAHPLFVYHPVDPSQYRRNRPGIAARGTGLQRGSKVQRANDYHPREAQLCAIGAFVIGR